MYLVANVQLLSSYQSHIAICAIDWQEWGLLAKRLYIEAIINDQRCE